MALMTKTMSSVTELSTRPIKVDLFLRKLWRNYRPVSIFRKRKASHPTVNPSKGRWIEAAFRGYDRLTKTLSFLARPRHGDGRLNANEGREGGEGPFGHDRINVTTSLWRWRATVRLIRVQYCTYLQILTVSEC